MFILLKYEFFNHLFIPDNKNKLKKRQIIIYTLSNYMINTFLYFLLNFSKFFKMDILNLNEK